MIKFLIISSGDETRTWRSGQIKKEEHLLTLTGYSILCLFLGRSLKMSSTQPGWMSMEGTPVPCPIPSPAAPWTARAPAFAPATGQDPAPAHARALTPVKHLTSTPTYVKPTAAARDQATSRVSVKAPEHVTAQDLDHAPARDPAQVPTKDPPFPHSLTASSLKGRHSHPSLTLLTPPPQAFPLSPTS